MRCWDMISREIIRLATIEKAEGECEQSAVEFAQSLLWYIGRKSRRT